MDEPRELTVGGVWGRWTILSPKYMREEPNGVRRAVVDCRCSCSNTKTVLAGNIRRGLSTSCGACLMPERPEAGDVIGQWTVLSVSGNHAVCECSCGNVRPVYVYSLGSDSLSCGHGNDGRRRAKLRRIWNLMIQRCYMEGCIGWEDYGGRGITVCEEWRDSFEAYYGWAIGQGYEMLSGMQIDRIDNEQGYSPENCRVTDAKTNARNKRNTVFVTAWGERKALTAWMEDERCTAEYATAWHRIRTGVVPEIALTAKRIMPAHYSRRQRIDSGGQDALF